MVLLGGPQVTEAFKSQDVCVRGVELGHGSWATGVPSRCRSKDAEINLGRLETLLAGSFHSSLNDRVWCGGGRGEVHLVTALVY